MNRKKRTRRQEQDRLRVQLLVANNAVTPQNGPLFSLVMSTLFWLVVVASVGLFCWSAWAYQQAEALVQ